MIKIPNIPFKFILLLFLSLRILTIAAAYTGIASLPFKPSFSNPEYLSNNYSNPLIWSWANFDGVHYLKISQSGYVDGLTQAFFPGYVLAAKAASLILQNKLLSALLVSHLSFIALLIVFYKLLRLDYDEKTTRWALVFLSFFPTSFYFLSAYTESLFLLLILTSFYFYRTGNTSRSVIFGIGVTLTRVTGIMLIPALWWEAKQKLKKLNPLTLSFLTIPSLGLFAYMTYLQIDFKDPLMFVHVQSSFGAGRETSRFVMLYQVIWRYVKMIITVDRTNPIYFTVWLEMVSSISTLGLLIWGVIKKIRPSYLLFSFLSFIVPTLTGTFSSMPRYVLVLFPIYILLAQIDRNPIRYFLLAVHIILLFICTMFFTRGYWIA